MSDTRHKNGLTLVELLVAMVVTSIVMTAVATLAFAVSSANKATDDTSEKQAQIRFATLRISELIRHCKLVCYVSADELAVWTADTNADGIIDIGELTYIEAGAAQDHLWLYTFTPSSSAEISLDSIGALATNWWSAYGSLDIPLHLIPECSNVTFYIDDLASQPKSRLVSITFDVVENEIARQYQINAALRGWAGNLLDDNDNIVSDDD